MAILAPSELPVVLKVPSDPMKAYVFRQLGYPHTSVELSEDQLEIALKVTGDFIAGYFPHEQRLAVFYTQPLQSTYPMPQDAYWIQDVAWDPVTTRIGDIFGAESFLFCVSPEFKVLDRFGKLQPIGDWKSDWKVKTPYGNKRLKIKHRDNHRSLPKIKIVYDDGEIVATSNHVLAIPGNKWRQFDEVKKGDRLIGVKNTVGVQNIEYTISTDAISLKSESGCYYGCINGNPILIH